MYIEFTIPKRSGGVRTIHAPTPELKQELKMILKELENTFKISRFAYAFKKGKNAYKNALIHVEKKYILNIDIKDFFPSITERLFFNRVTFENKELKEKVKKLCFYQNRLPQGSPTSPFLANLYLAEFDYIIYSTLKKYISNDIKYTRYADDLTFSSNSFALANAIKIIRDVLAWYGLELNEDKINFLQQGGRIDVTGYAINSGKPTVSKSYRKKVRAICHKLSQGYVLTEKQKQKLLGMIAHIETAHKEEANKYKQVVLNAKTISDATTRKLNIYKQVKLDVSVKHDNVAYNSNEKINNTNIVRKIRI